MKTLKLTTQVKKDLKRYKHHQSTIEALEAVLGFLARGEQNQDDYVKTESLYATGKPFL